MALKESLYILICGLCMWNKIIVGEELTNPSVAVGGTAAQYKTLNFKVPVYLNNPMDTIGGFTLIFTRSDSRVVDFTAQLDTTGSLVSNFDLLNVSDSVGPPDY